MYFAEIFGKALSGDTQSIFFFIAAYWLLACLISVVIQLRMQCWPSVSGQLIEAGVVRVGRESVSSEQSYMADALYTYQVAGRDYQGRKVSSWVLSASGGLRGLPLLQLKGIQRHADGSVVVYHHPAKPEKSILILPGRVSILITCLLATIPALLYLLRYYS